MYYFSCNNSSDFSYFWAIRLCRVSMINCLFVNEDNYSCIPTIFFPFFTILYVFNQNFRHHNWRKLLTGNRCLAEWGMAMNCSSYVQATVCDVCSMWPISKLYDRRNEFLAENCGVKLRRTKYEFFSMG